MKIYLIRHAKIDGNLNLVQSDEDHIVLSEETKIKAEEVNRIINTNREMKIYCSKLIRAKETADLIFSKNQKIVYTELLNEYIRPSRLVGKDRKQLIKFWEEDHKIDKYNPYWKPEDGESYYECASRAYKFYKNLLKDKERGLEKVAVIGHGTFFRHLVCAIVGIKWRKNPKIVIDLLRQFEWKNLEVKVFDL